MNKRNKQFERYAFNRGIALGIFMCLICLVFLYFLFNLPEGNSYKSTLIISNITENVCKNEIGNVGFDWLHEGDYGYNSNISNYTLDSVGLYKSEEVICRKLLKEDYSNKKIFYGGAKYYGGNGIGLECNANELLINDSFYYFGDNLDITISNNKIENMFNESKVFLKNGKIYSDNLYFFNTFNVVYDRVSCEKNIVNEFKVIQPQTLYFDKCTVENTENGVSMTINKECLQQNPNWLKENCECDNWNCPSGFEKENEYNCAKVAGDTKIIQFTYCSSYKCENKYTIGVENE